MAIALMPGLYEPPRDENGRHIIRLPGRRVDVVNATIAALAELELFQRGGGLVDIVRDPEPGEGGVFVPSGEPRVRIIPFARLHELATLACQYLARRKDEQKSAAAGTIKYSDTEVDPPAAIIKTLMERGEWAHIRPLDAMVSWPVLRPDGSVFDGVGYDALTRCYSTASVKLNIPPCITPKHVEDAVALLHDLVCDFPFEKPEHRSAWLSSLLTVLARPAIKGPVPMVIFDANDRGTGKTLLCDLIGAILTGQRLPRRGVPEKGSEDEWGKLMLGIGIGGYAIVLLDNVTNTLRSSTLDMVLTGEVYQGRVLGLNKEMKVPVRTMFMVSSNNAMISTDLVRRSVHSRLISPTENPEKRVGFRHKLPDYAVENREALLTAAFTILLGYEQAGRPNVKREPIGSYDAWSARVQAAMVWAGLPDPVLTQAELRDQADGEGEQLGQLLTAWYDLLGSTETSAKEALSKAQEETDETRYGKGDPKAIAFLEAVQSLGEGKRVTTSQLGYRLRKWKDKWLNSMRFCSGTIHRGTLRWKVEKK